MDNIILLLKNILDSESTDKNELVSSFQNKVWNDRNVQDETLHEILSELAYDLDYYEPKESLRKESSSYYGNERLAEEVKLGLQKIEDYIASSR